MLTQLTAPVSIQPGPTLSQVKSTTLTISCRKAGWKTANHDAEHTAPHNLMWLCMRLAERHSLQLIEHTPGHIMPLPGGFDVESKRRRQRAKDGVLCHLLWTEMPAQSCIIIVHMKSECWQSSADPTHNYTHHLNTTVLTAWQIAVM